MSTGSLGPQHQRFLELLMNEVVKLLIDRGFESNEHTPTEAFRVATSRSPVYGNMGGRGSHRWRASAL